MIKRYKPIFTENILPNSYSKYDDKYNSTARSWIDNARKKSTAYQKYIAFVVDRGYLSPSASSVFEDWLDENYKNLTLKEVKQALDDLWPGHIDDQSKSILLGRANTLGIRA